jgi:hypothetical protein
MIGAQDHYYIYLSTFLNAIPHACEVVKRAESEGLEVLDSGVLKKL